MPLSMPLSMPIPISIPVAVIGGFLGAGKTTLVNQLLRQCAGQRLAVLVNDFGELPIDADLIEARDGNLLRLAGGCVCCAFGSDLMAALLQLRDMQPAPAHVLIETSGVALPGAVVRTLGLVDGLVLDAVLVLADAETLRERAADRHVGDVVRQQLCDADLLLLTKIDRVDAQTLAATQAWLRESLGPQPPIVPLEPGCADAAALLGVHREARGRATLPVHTPALRPLAPRHERLFDSVSLQFAHAVHLPQLADALSALRLLRAKGLLRDAAGRSRSLQLVGARVALADAVQPAAAPGRRVCIGLRGQLDADAVRRAVAASAASSGASASPCGRA
jgi:G3E family GTPase